MREVNFDEEHEDEMTARDRLLKDFGVTQDQPDLMKEDHSMLREDITSAM